MKIEVTDMHTSGEPVRIVTGGYPDFNVFGVLERDHALRAAEEMVTQLRSKGTKPEPRVHDAATQIEVINPTLCGLAVERSCRRDLMWRFREASAAFLPYGDADHARAYDKLRNRIEAFSRSRSDDDGLVEEDVSVTRACFDAYEACGGKRADEFRRKSPSRRRRKSRKWRQSSPGRGETLHIRG